MFDQLPTIIIGPGDGCGFRDGFYTVCPTRSLFSRPFGNARVVDSTENPMETIPRVRQWSTKRIVDSNNVFVNRNMASFVVAIVQFGIGSVQIWLEDVFRHGTLALRTGRTSKNVFCTYSCIRVCSADLPGTRDDAIKTRSYFS